MSSSEFDVAIIGMACRFPQSPTPAAYWANLRDGRECISRFSKEELLRRGVPRELIEDSEYVPASGIIDDVERFDAPFFGYLPREAQLMDPQQRLSLYCAWEALEDAGYAPNRIEGNVGVFAGATMNTYLVQLLLTYPNLVEVFGDQHLMLTNDKDFLPLRISYKLGLKGPSVGVQAACATSLVAVHFACRSLIAGECDMALAGGASVRVPHGVGYMYKEQGTSSPDGRVRAFDADANGSVAGSGAGMVVLKRLDDALRDGDNVRAVIKGTGLSNDGGTKATFTAPSADGQMRAMLEAYATAQISAETVSYVECHGTATRLGDPIEVSALTKTFRQMTKARGICLLGSVKPNIGHLDAGSGVAGLIKTVLSMEHGFIPATLNFKTPNPELQLDSSPFRIADRLTEWRSNGGVRRAGINAIGMGGINTHCLIEEAPPRAERAAPKREWFVLPIAARTPTAHARLVQQVSEQRQKADVELADVATTLQVGRTAFEQRGAWVVRRDLSALASKPPKVTPRERPQVVFMFPGQGAQYAGMGAGLYEAEPVYRDAFEQCAKWTLAAGGPNITEAVLGAEGSSNIDSTDVTQPALFAVSYALAQLLGSWGIAPDRLLGHSVGEFVAAVLGNVMSLEHALQLVVARGKLLQSIPEGAMLAVGLDEQLLLNELDEGFSVAAVNAPSQCVVSGTPASIEAFEQRLTQREVPVRRLRVSRAFHSPMVDPVLPALQQVADRVTLRPPTQHLISTVTGSRLTNEQATDPSYWVRHSRATVRFMDAIRAAVGNGRAVLIECGASQALTGYSRRMKDQVALPCMRCRGDAAPDIQILLQMVAAAWEHGLDVDWTKLSNGAGRRISMPTYPFEGARAWVDVKRTTHAPASEASRPSAIARNGSALSIQSSNHQPEPTPNPTTVDASNMRSSTKPLNAEITITADSIVIRTNPGVALGATVSPVQLVQSVAAPLVAAPATEQPAVRATREPTRATPPTPSAVNGSAVVEPGPASESNVEKQIGAAIEELLGIPDVSGSANLRDLGADSLMMTQLLTRLRRTVYPDLSMKILDAHGSVSSLARFIENATRSAPSVPPPSPAPSAGNQSVDALVSSLSQLTPEEVERELAALGEGDER